MKLIHHQIIYAIEELGALQYMSLVNQLIIQLGITNIPCQIPEYQV